MGLFWRFLFILFAIRKSNEAMTRLNGASNPSNVHHWLSQFPFSIATIHSRSLARSMIWQRVTLRSWERGGVCVCMQSVCVCVCVVRWGWGIRGCFRSVIMVLGFVVRACGVRVECDWVKRWSKLGILWSAGGFPLGGWKYNCCTAQCKKNKKTFKTHIHKQTH